MKKKAQGRESNSIEFTCPQRLMARLPPLPRIVRCGEYSGVHLCAGLKDGRRLGQHASLLICFREPLGLALSGHLELFGI